MGSSTSGRVISSYDDPNKPSPSQIQQRRVWSRLIKRIRLPRSSSHPKIPKSLVPLTERNLTELFNPDYCDEHHAFHEFRSPRKISIPEWLQLLP